MQLIETALREFLEALHSPHGETPENMSQFLDRRGLSRWRDLLTTKDGKSTVLGMLFVEFANLTFGLGTARIAAASLEGCALTISLVGLNNRTRPTIHVGFAADGGILTLKD
jgi:hypothetical protein